MSAKGEILQLIGALSEYECAHMLAAFQRVAVGERFWEMDLSTVYNEQVKTRIFHSNESSISVAPSIPQTDQGLFVPIPINKSLPGAQRISLPAPAAISGTLGQALTSRRSRREYTGESISLQKLSTLLDGACGVSGVSSGYGYRRLPLCTFPSSGGLHSPEVYLSAQFVDGVSPGLYHFNLQDHALELLRGGSYGPELRSLAMDQPCLETASVVFLITGCFDRLRWKYGDRAFKYMCMDIGYLGQNLYLVAEALALGACAIAGFYDDGIERFLAVDDPSEIPLLLTTVGVPRATAPASAVTY